MCPVVLCYPDLGPSRRNRQLLDACFYRLVLNATTIAIGIGKAIAATPAAKREARRLNVNQAISAAEFSSISHRIGAGLVGLVRVSRAVEVFGKDAQSAISRFIKRCVALRVPINEVDR